MSREQSSDETERAARDEAQFWIVRLASGKMTADEGDALRRWRAADPAHARAFAEAKRHWRLIGEAAGDFVGAAAPGGKARLVTRRRALIAGAAAAAAAAGVVAVRPPFELWTPFVDFSADYRTGVGEIRTIALGAAVEVRLSTRSRLALRSDAPSSLRVALLAGEADVASPGRPVVVVAGDGEVRAAAGRFNIRNDGGEVRVTCLAGETEVACGGGAAAALRPGRQMRYGAKGLGVQTAADSEEITAWQRGILVFHDRELRHVVDEINRYRPGKIILLDPRIGRRPVAVASFHLDRLDEVVSQMEALYGVRARRLPGGIVLLG